MLELKWYLRIRFQVHDRVASKAPKVVKVGPFLRSWPLTSVASHNEGSILTEILVEELLSTESINADLLWPTLVQFTLDRLFEAREKRVDHSDCLALR